MIPWGWGTCAPKDIAKGSWSGKKEGKQFTGKGTFWGQSAGGNCQIGAFKDTDFTCALDGSQYENGAHCGKFLVIQRLAGTMTNGTATPKELVGRQVIVKVVDQCPSCGGPGFTDLSAAAFSWLGFKEEGKIDIASWYLPDEEGIKEGVVENADGASGGGASSSSPSSFSPSGDAATGGASGANGSSTDKSRIRRWCWRWCRWRSWIWNGKFRQQAI
ncbi:hypothetical protein IE81DRAFT_221020 [Ceraceosorus guamensis]|uniref:RlpA-like protein double-psi beta-barrel domain-containing protein n=1 Tax=Ceraceosorus guamensis TaxID=1522189 RepID=A0A316VS68_9BASI|nr:hypothetical protein IE81DRAFT_221020 [Ceraceosorus guamensis]PWN40446.1 hypothetical protein IE81DRAFT_221020 [Ceraceosorus guamensis]